MHAITPGGFYYLCIISSVMFVPEGIAKFICLRDIYHL